MKKQGYREMNLLEFHDRFPNEEACLAYLIQMRFPRGFVCPKCSHTKGCWKPSRQEFQCYRCQAVASPTAGTMFHKSRVALRKWFWCIYLMATSKKGISTLYLQEQVGLGSYPTAWLMTQKIRKAMKDRAARYQLEGLVQTDEIWIGGKRTRRERRAKGNNKTPFLIAVDEAPKGGPRFVAFEELEDVYEKEILPALEKHVHKGSTLKSDGAGVYVKAQQKGYKLQREIYQQDKEKTQDHLYWLNMLTSNLKRFLLSTYHGVYPKYRETYLAEFAYRFNRRFWPHQAFDRLLFAGISTGFTTLHGLQGLT